ncbi:unnamed protein product [Ceutorhynchus assimilis]|uniref:Uncharacterized protein n=1 Tax=Ceutorhynchus assimilis TaxID=467358 RepID=A0A9N9MUU6_9CUCU|nr:unnamed protein product [Ceutorhynchus assimilis]
MTMKTNATTEGNFIELTTTESLFNLSQIDYNNETINDTFYCEVNHNGQVEQYYVLLPILLICCLIAMIVNVIVIASAYWIRCPMTPNLKMSLSLAAADAASSTMYGTLVLISDYGFNLGVFPCVLELLRLSGIGKN